MRTPPLLADFIHPELCKPFCENFLTLPGTPADNAALTGKMRHVLSAPELYELIRSMPGEELIHIENDAERQNRFAAILREGDRHELIRLIKTLYQQQLKRREQKKKVHMADEKCMHEAEKMLYEEFAYVLHIPSDQVVSFITEQLESAG